MVNHEYTEAEHEANFEQVVAGEKVFRFTRHGYVGWVRGTTPPFQLLHATHMEDEWRDAIIREPALKAEQRRLDYELRDPDEFPDPDSNPEVKTEVNP